ncbi:hypothetical protein HDU67_006521 [Dinochytrium kinnereticum]|nr:hypothetical protein HDU67_006521 [Dinochytrium kinnereticum]
MSDFKVVLDMPFESSSVHRSDDRHHQDAIELQPSASVETLPQNTIMESSSTSEPTSQKSLTSGPEEVMSENEDVSTKEGMRKRKRGIKDVNKQFAKSGEIMGKGLAKTGKVVGKGFLKTGGALGSVWDDFANFLRQGAVVDLAVGLVLGAAFTTLINSVVTDLVAPIIGLAIEANLQNAFIVLRCGKNSTNSECKAGSQSGYGTVAIANVISNPHNKNISDEEVSQNAYVCKWCAHEFDMEELAKSQKPKFPAIIIPSAFKPRKKSTLEGETLSSPETQGAKSQDEIIVDGKGKGSEVQSASK